jgi:hypothetical protein
MSGAGFNSAARLFALSLTTAPGQIEGKRASTARYAAQANCAAQKGGQLAADGETEAGAAVAAAGAGVGLMERFKNDPLLVKRNADARVVNLKGNHAAGAAQHGVIGLQPPFATQIRKPTWPWAVNL